MSRVLVFIIFLWVALTSKDSIADIQIPKSIHPNTPLNSLILKQWTAEDGLISNNLTSVNVDMTGFLWITCFNGVLKFDGNTFQLFDTEDFDFLHSNGFMKMTVSDDSTIWFSTQASGVVKNTKSIFSVPAFNDNLPKYIRTIHIDPNGRLWIGTNNAGLYRVSNGDVESIDYQFVSDITIMDITSDEEGKVYIATFKNGLIVIDDNLFTQYTVESGLYSDNINCLYLKGDDLYIGTVSGMNVLRNGNIDELSFLEGTEINEIVEDGYESLWIATEMGLARKNDLYDVEEFFGTAEGLPTRQVSGLVFDHEGNLWLATKKGGLMRMKLGNFNNYTETDGLALNQVNIIEEKEPGIMYVGSDDGAINIIQDKKVYDYTISTDLGNNGIRDFCFVDDELWIGSYAGLLIKKGNIEELLTEASGLPASDIRRVRKDSRGNIWVATRSGGLIKFVDKKIETIYNKENGLQTNYVLCMQEDVDNNLWVGTNGGGLSKISKEGSVSTYSIFEDPSGILIFNIFCDQNNIKYLATNVGIFRFDGKEFKEIIISSTSQNDTFFDIIFDDQDGIWITSNIGLYRIKKADLNAFILGEAIAVPSTLFDHNDGLQNKECTGATRSLKASDGVLWIPTLGGVATINPADIRENHILPPVLITDFLTDRSGEFLSEELAGDDVTLEPGNFRYRIKFTALSYQAPRKVRFRYKLENIDNDWIETVNVREALYTNLSPGKYKFWVIACNNDNYWNTEGASFSFRIKPFLYQRVEIYIVGFFMLIGLAWIGYKRRINSIENRNKELKKVNEELDKFVYSASHDLKAPLNSVMGLINVAKKDGASANLPLYLDMIEKSIKRLERFISDIIDYSRNTNASMKITSIDFPKMVNEALEEIKYLESDNEIEIKPDINGKGDFYNDERRISVILNNLLSNAVKYHDPRKSNREIRIGINFSSRKAEIAVEDNGTGIAEEHQKKIFEMFYRANEDNKGSGLGLYIVKETLDKLKGTIFLDSKRGSGSKFVVELPSLKPN